MNKRSKVIFIIIIVAVVSSGLVSYKWYKNRPSQRQAEVSKKIAEYYSAKPRTINENQLENANSNLTPAPADSLCAKFGFKYQIQGDDGTAVCTVGYH